MFFRLAGFQRLRGKDAGCDQPEKAARNYPETLISGVFSFLPFQSSRSLFSIVFDFVGGSLGCVAKSHSCKNAASSLRFFISVPALPLRSNSCWIKCIA